MRTTHTTWLVRALAVVAAVALLFMGTTPASARSGKNNDHGNHGGGRGPVTLADGLVGPLQIDVTKNGDILVAQDFSGVLSSLDKKGNVTDLVSLPGEEIAGVAAGPHGAIYFTHGVAGGTTDLLVRDRQGQVTQVADLGAYETANNPDQVNTYGFEGITDECAALLPPELGPASYTGGVDSHPYALAVTKSGLLVADAGGNDILLVDWSGNIHLVAVLPPQPTAVTAEGAAANGLPDCVIGSTYAFEPVPTDVEIGHRGSLLVTTLPGGPEDPSLGARGSVYNVNQRTGSSTQMATGFAGATNLAVAPNGTIYVAELFGGQVSKVVDGAPSPVAIFDSPAAVEWDRGRLLVTTEVFASGKVVSVPI